MKELLQGFADTLTQVIHLVTVQHQSLVLLIEQNHQLVSLVLEQRAEDTSAVDDETGVYDLKGNRVQ